MHWLLGLLLIKIYNYFHLSIRALIQKLECLTQKFTLTSWFKSETSPLFRSNRLQGLFCWRGHIVLLFPGLEFVVLPPVPRLLFLLPGPHPTPTQAWRRGEKTGQGGRTYCTAVKMLQCSLGLTDVYTEPLRGQASGCSVGFPVGSPYPWSPRYRRHVCSSGGYTTRHPSQPHSLPAWFFRGSFHTDSQLGFSVLRDRIFSRCWLGLTCGPQGHPHTQWTPGLLSSSLLL